MKNCSYMYMLYGMQFCKYPSINCVYKGKTKTLQLYIHKNYAQGNVTICKLNYINNINKDITDKLN